METEIKPVEQAPVVPAVEVKQEESLISRATKVELPKVETTPTEEKFDFKEYQAILDGVKDPVQKSILEKAYKSFQSGFDGKFQTLARERDALKVEQAKLQETQRWTPERLKAEINKQDFIESAKQITVVPEVPNENSLLSTEEQAKLRSMDDEIRRLKELNQQTIQQQQAQLTQRQDEEYKAKYANYDPRAIDTITSDMLEGRAQVTREHIYKAYYHDDNMRRSYELGKQDAIRDMKERAGSASIVPNGATKEVGGIAPNEGEKPIDFFRRLGQKNLSEMRTTQR